MFVLSVPYVQLMHVGVGCCVIVCVSVAMCGCVLCWFELRCVALRYDIYGVRGLYCVVVWCVMLCCITL